MSRKRTHEDYVKEINKINSNIEVVGQYIGANIKILHRCKIDGYEWHVAPNVLLHGSGCPMCYGNIKKTHDSYMKELLEINPYIEVIGSYINNKTKILHRCKIDGYEWEVSPSNILSGKGCPVCSKKKKRSHDEYINEVAKLNKNIEVIGEYTSCNIKMLHKCKIDGCEWYATPNNILKGKGCPKCSGNKKKTHEEYVKNVYFINQDIEVIGNYTNAHASILHKCKVCGLEWSASPNTILSGSGCPKCKKSKGEKIISSWFDKMNILYEQQKTFENCKDINLLSYDFYLPEYNLCVEYQGQQHYYPVNYFGGEDRFKIQQKHDDIKRKYCKDNNIMLIEIPYYKDIYEELIKMHELMKEKYTEKEVIA